MVADLKKSRPRRSGTRGLQPSLRVGRKRPRDPLREGGRAAPPPGPRHANQTVAKLRRTLSELRVTQEILRNQNTELARARTYLENERARYQEMFDHAPDGYLVTDRHGKILESNLAAAHLLDGTPEHLMGRPVTLFLPAVDGDTLYMRLQRLTPTHAVEEWETTLHPSTTRTVPVTVRINPVVDRSGVVTGLRWLVRDNGPRQRAATALWQERNFISAVLDTTAALIAVLDTRGYIVRFNRACERVTGYTFAEVSNAPFWEILLRPDETAGVKEVFSNLMAGHFPNQHENCWTTKDGRQRLIRWSNTVLHDVDGAIEYIVATGVDITDQRAAEEQARRQQQALTHSMRVSTIGEMASGLAHEINQPLTAIASYAQGCLHRVESGDTALRPLVDTVRHIATQAQRAATIVQHLRYFVAKAEPHRVDTDLNGLIRDAVSFARTESAHGGCDVSLELGSIPPVVVDDIQIQQVVLNLLRNAFDSLAGTPQGQRRVQVRTLLNNQQEAETIVSDNGPGLPPEAAARLFEPFYTTKPQGMGLGLAICRTIIEDHGGRLWVVPGGTVGADFHFTLPLSNGNHGA